MAKHRIKWLSLALVTLMLCIPALAACNSETPSSATQAPEQTQAAAKTETPAETTDDGGSEEPAAALDPVTLYFYFGYDSTKAATNEVWAAVGDYLRPELNATFDVQFIAGTDYQDKMRVKAASGDKWDLSFEGDWVTYYTMIARDAYLPLDDLLPQYAPDLYAAYQKSGVLEAAKSKGKVVALPWTMSMTFRPFFQWRGDLAKSAGLDIDPTTIKTVEDVDVLVYKLQTAYPDKKILENSSLDAFLVQYNYKEIAHHYVIDLNDPTLKAVPVEQTQAYRSMSQWAKKWQDDGIIWKDVLNDNLDHNQLIDQGQLITKWGTSEFSRSTRAWAEEGAYWDSNPLYMDNKFANRTPLANCLAIPVTSENPERTLMFLNKLETDRELYDMVHYGILGKTYELDGEAAVYPEGMTQANSNYMDWGSRWALWKPQFMRPDATYPANFWVEEADFVRSSTNNVVSPLEGFNFDAEAVKTEVAQRDQIYDAAHKMLPVGLAGDPDAAVDKLIADTKNAGVDAITVELQRQIDAFLASKK